MQSFPSKTFTANSSGHIYSYIHQSPIQHAKPTILFLHGFPSHALSWHHQLTHFSSLGYGILAPDLLGFGSSSHPHAASEYRSAAFVPELLALLDHEGLQDSLHGVGHDAGVYILSRLWNCSPARFQSLTFTSVPYSPPGQRLDVAAMNAFAKQKVGFEKFGYIEFLAREGSEEVLKAHLERFIGIAFNADVEKRAREFYPPEKLEAWLTREGGDEDEGETILSEDERKAWLDAYRKSGLRGATNGYRVMMQNLNFDEEEKDVEAGKVRVKIGVPVLGIDSRADSASIPGFVEGGTKVWVEDGVQSSFVTVGSQGHYPQIVSREEVNTAMEEFFRELEDADRQI